MFDAAAFTRGIVFAKMTRRDRGLGATEWQSRNHGADISLPSGSLSPEKLSPDKRDACFAAI
ncbi:MAG: hypothetical protein KGK16_10335, partial [Bradyrhizobium sp.]|nr:hypothetical protein [Bradyrhizobium sp.]